MMAPHESRESDRPARSESPARFDPYHSWLAIPPEEQPPNHYRLLGVNLFESDREVIRNAADQRMTYLKTFGAGHHSTLSQTLLNEVSAAKVCLLNEPKKRAYDEQLRKQTASQRPPAGSQTQDHSVAPQVVVDTSPSVQPGQERRPFGRKEWAIGAVAMLLLLIVGVMVRSVINPPNPPNPLPTSEGPGLGNEDNPVVEDWPGPSTGSTHVKPLPPITNSIGMKLVLIPAGDFMMGSPADEEGRHVDEGPVHQVRITKPFYLGVKEVTQGQWEAVMGTRPWEGEKWTKSGAEHAVSSVSWDDADHFCQTLSALPAEKSAGRAYGLPTEAEWEYACRADSRTRYYFGAKALGLGSNAQYDQNTSNVGEKYAHPVGLKLPNDWGLYDMHGNVWEWCQDRYGKGYYANSRVDNPEGPSTGSNRVFRGGSWYSDPGLCRSAIRSELAPDSREVLLGFRVALVPEESRKEEPAESFEETAVDSPTEPPPDKPISNSIGMELVLIPAGEFMMGSLESAEELAAAYEKYGSEGIEDEHPRHLVRITKQFYLGTYEVTVGQFRQFVEDDGYQTEAERDEGGWGYNEEEKTFQRKPEYTWRNMGFPQTDDHPVVSVTWNDAVTFCQWLSRKERKTYRLPTEAQWEYACRAGTTTRYYNGDDPERLVRVGNVADADARAKFDPLDLALNGAVSSRDGFVFTAPVGRFQPNAWGLYDMHGNVWEWCWDPYVSGYYKNSPTYDPEGPPSSSLRGFRGGGWRIGPKNCRSAFRFGITPDIRDCLLGFRVALDLAESHEKESPQAPEEEAGDPQAESREKRAVEPLKLTTNSIDMELVLIPAGQFMMGSPADEEGRNDNEGPAHEVWIKKPFFLGVAEVTQEQWEAVIGTRPWEGKTNVKSGPEYAATYVSWDDAVEFCRKLSEGEEGTYRLPTEAEWEYACRAGSGTRYCFGNNDLGLGSCAWFGWNANDVGEKHACPVGLKRANDWGLYDMHGNVWEWCSDPYGSAYYKNSPTDDPKGPPSGLSRVLRGGCWNNYPWKCRSAYRDGIPLDITGDGLGFRVALVPAE